MAGLMGLLDMGVGAFNAQTAGVSVVGNNIANVATEGYSRQSVTLTADALIGGVRADGVLRSESELLAGRQRDVAGSFGYSQSTSMALLDLDGQLAVAEGNVVDGLAAFFGDLIDLSSAPLDSTLRLQLVTGAQSLVESFRSSSRAASEAMTRSDGRMSMLAGEATQYAAQIAAANETLAIKFDPTIADQRELAATRLAELVGGRARIDPDGNMRFVAAQGVVVVDGTRPAVFETTPDAALGGRLRLEVVDGVYRQDVTAGLDGGKIAGEIAFRDGPASQTLERLDALAFDFASAVNAAHLTNAAPDGTTGLTLFDVAPTATGAAGTLAVTAVVAGDPGLLATAAVGAGPGDTAGLQDLLDLRDALGAAGAQRTFIDEAISAMASVGSQAQEANGAQELERARTDVIAALRDSLSGVSLEEEMMRLSQLQRSAQAASTFVSTVDEMLAGLLSRL